MGRFYWILPLFFQLLLWIPIRCALEFFCKFTVRGQKYFNISRERGIIFAANHISETDPLAVAVALPFLGKHFPLFFASAEPRFFARKKFGWRAYIYSTPFFFKMLGSFPVYAGKNDFEKALPLQIELLEKKESVLFFPEGVLRKNNGQRRARPGIGFLLHRTNAVIIPVAIFSTYNMSFLKFLMRKYPITVTLGEPIEKKDIFKDMPNPQLKDFEIGANEIMVRIEKLLR